MNELMNNPAFHTYAARACILAIKMLLGGNYTSVVRMRTKGFVNVEDAKAFGGTPSEQEHPAVAHALRIQRNDGENIPLFWAVGLVFVMSGASANAAWWYCWTGRYSDETKEDKGGRSYICNIANGGATDVVPVIPVNAGQAGYDRDAL